MSTSCRLKGIHPWCTAKPNDSNEAEWRERAALGQFDGVREKEEKNIFRLYVVALSRASLGSVNGLSFNNNDVGGQHEVERKFICREGIKSNENFKSESFLSTEKEK